MAVLFVRFLSTRLMDDFIIEAKLFWGVLLSLHSYHDMRKEPRLRRY